MKPILAALFAAALFTACSSSNGPGGTLKVNLTSPNSGADSAMVLRINGPGTVTSASAGAGLQVWTLSPIGSNPQIAITGRLASGTILTFGVSDISQATAYTATVVQVSTPQYQLRTNIASYSLTVTQ